MFFKVSLVVLRQHQQPLHFTFGHQTTSSKEKLSLNIYLNLTSYYFLMFSQASKKKWQAT